MTFCTCVCNTKKLKEKERELKACVFNKMRGKRRMCSFTVASYPPVAACLSVNCCPCYHLCSLRDGTETDKCTVNCPRTEDSVDFVVGRFLTDWRVEKSEKISLKISLKFSGQIFAQTPSRVLENFDPIFFATKLVGLKKKERTKHNLVALVLQ